jgi:hypothetical protein
MGRREIDQDKLRIQIFDPICESENLNYMSCIILNKFNIPLNFKRMN